MTFTAWLASNSEWLIVAVFLNNFCSDPYAGKLQRAA
jgi:hypothetical protein